MSMYFFCSSRFFISPDFSNSLSSQYLLASFLLSKVIPSITLLLLLYFLLLFLLLDPFFRLIKIAFFIFAIQFLQYFATAFLLVISEAICFCHRLPPVINYFCVSFKTSHPMFELYSLKFLQVLNIILLLHHLCKSRVVLEAFGLL